MTSDDKNSRKKYITKIFSQDDEMKGVILENYTKAYEEMRTALIAAARLQRKVSFFPVDFKIPKFKRDELRAKYRSIYESYRERAADLPLELLKANLPTRVAAVYKEVKS